MLPAAVGEKVVKERNLAISICYYIHVSLKPRYFRLYYKKYWAQCSSLSEQ